jgi:hypothetical protein
MELKEYTVTLISKDGQKFQCDMKSDTDNGAISGALQIIAEKGWSMYEYKLHQLERVK